MSTPNDITLDTLPSELSPPAKPASSWKRYAPVAVLAAGIGTVLALRLDQYLSLEQLRLHRSELTTYVAAMPVQATLLFTFAYALATALSVPGAIVLTLTGGFLFGIWHGTAAVVVGATLGATVVFLAARSALGDMLRAKAGPWLARMEEGFREDAFSYLLVLRLVPAIPFFIVNLVPAFLGASLRTFVTTTALGIIPGTFVFASIGAGLGSIFDSTQEFTLKGILTPQVITGLVGLSLLSLMPVVLRKVRARRGAAL